ncbi:MAG: hypothetical protein Q8942_17150 [Bacillota bacterium]|nr:hypothetical protein [Bacillota bacterium]
MDRNKTLESMSNALAAANKILDLKNSSLHNDLSSNTRSTRNIQFNTLCEMLNTLASYSPPKYKDVISNSVAISSRYRDTYKKLQQHKNSRSNEKIDSREILKTLEILKPVLPNQHKTVVEKIQKIYEIIYS